mgnify:CR=1 FL=1
MKHTHLIAASLVASSSFLGIAHAQAAAPEARPEEAAAADPTPEIVVTAERRSQSVLTTPIRSEEHTSELQSH